MYFSGVPNNCKSKIKSRKIISTTPNTKIHQNQAKIRKINRTPINTLNKSQNFSITKKVFGHSDIKILKKFHPIQINPKRIFPMHNLKNMNFKFKTKNLKLHPFIYDNNKNHCKTNSLSNITKTVSKISHNLRKTHSNTNIINITNTNTTNYNGYIKNNFYYNSKPNNLRKNSFKIRDILNTEDLSISKNLNKQSNLYPLVITEESKKSLNENISKMRIKKSESTLSKYPKNYYPPIQKLKTYSTTTLTKHDFILSNNENNSNNQENTNPVTSNNKMEIVSSEKKNTSDFFNTFENKIINEIKEFKNYKSNEIIDKIKEIFKEVIEYLVPKESQNIFSMLLKEIFNINKEYLDNLNNSKEIIEKYKMKIFHYEKKNRGLMGILKNKEKEINNFKNEIEKLNKESKIFTNLKIHKIYENFDKKRLKKNISLNELEKKSNNSFITKLNIKNVDDLDALYFFDKVNCMQNNDIEKEMPKLNLEEKYIDKCIKNELIKRNEVKLTPFQKIAMQFEMLDS